MQLQEKKYLVKSFRSILKIINEKNLTKSKEVHSTHYYGEHKGNDVEKFVEYPDRVEVHVLKEVDGKFVPTDDFRVKNKSEGIAWLKKRGFSTANIVKMDYDEYEYKGGTLGLYTIDNFLLSVILNYPPGKHEEVEKEFNLQNAEQLTIPYNKQLRELGKLRSVSLE
jgi:hypothetical protein